MTGLLEHGTRILVSRRYWANFPYQIRCALAATLGYAAVVLYSEHPVWSLICLVFALTCAEMIGQKYRLAYHETNDESAARENP